MKDTEQELDDFKRAFDSAFFRLRARVEHGARVPTIAWSARVATAIGAALEFAAEDPEAAQALTGDALAWGREGFARYDRMLTHFEGCVRLGRSLRPNTDPLPEITERAAVGGLARLISERLARGEANKLPEIGPPAIQFVLTPYLGVQEARQVAADAAGASPVDAALAAPRRLDS